jgi:hypothetical protein
MVKDYSETSGSQRYDTRTIGPEDEGNVANVNKIVAICHIFYQLLNYIKRKVSKKNRLLQFSDSKKEFSKTVSRLDETFTEPEQFIARTAYFGVFLEDYCNNR